MVFQSRSRLPEQGGEGLNPPSNGNSSESRGVDSAVQRKPKSASRNKAVGQNLSDPDDMFNLIGDDGAVTSEALKLAGLRPEDASRISQIVDMSWSEIAEDMKARAVISKNNEGGGSVTIDIPADQSSGDNQLAKLEARLNLEFGEHASKNLLSGLHSWQYFGDFGRMDIRLTFGPDPDAASMSPEEVALYGLDGEVLQMKVFDPKSGQLRSSAKYSSEERMKRHLGGLADFARAIYRGGQKGAER